MTIRHKNLYSKPFAQPAIVIHRQQQSNENCQIIQRPSQTPRFANTKNLNAMNPQYISTAALRDKQQNIRNIDERINEILQKHKNKENSQSPSKKVDLKGLYEREYQINAAKQVNMNHERQIETERKADKRANGLESKRMKQECQIIRERSSKIFRKDRYDRKSLYKLQEYAQEQIADKYENEIDQLSKRIKETEQNKKKLNINYSPFHFKSKSNTNIKPESSRSVSNIRYLSSIEQAGKKENRQEVRIKEFTSGEADDVNLAKKSGGIIKNRTKRQSNIQTQVVVNRIYPAAEIAISKPESPLKYSFFPNTPSLHHSTTLSSNNEPSKQRNILLQQFLNALQKQIELDENLRNYKIWLTCSKLPNKWKVLEEAVLNKNMSITTERIRELFESSMSEHNPFFRWDNVCEQKGLELLLEGYQRAEQYWAENIQKKLSFQLLAQLKKRSINLVDPSVMLIQDLLKWMNSSSTTFYRSRDVLLIYRRLVERYSTQKAISQQYLITF